MVDFPFVIISLALMVETIRVELGRSRRFTKGGGSVCVQISGGVGHCPPTAVDIITLE